jgi:nucleoside-diphosphate-sugar epimerase
MKLDYLIDTKRLDLFSTYVDFSSFNGKKILITGGTGMIGSYLAEAIIRGSELQGVSPHKIMITGKSPAPELIQKFASNKNVDVSIDLFDSSSKDSCYEVVFHLASPASPKQYQNLESLIQINSECLVNVINSCTEKFVFISTGEVYGNKGGILTEEDHGVFGHESPRDWYPYAKLKGEETSKQLCTEFNSELNIIRLFHTFGPGVRKYDGRSFADFLYSAASGEFPKLYSDGSALRTFLFSADAVLAMLLIATNGINLRTYNVGSDLPISIRDFAVKVSEIAGLKGKIEFDSKLARGLIPSPNEALIPDLRRVSELGWSIRTTLDEAIENTLSFIKSSH